MLAIASIVVEMFADWPNLPSTDGVSLFGLFRDEFQHAIQLRSERLVHSSRIPGFRMTCPSEHISSMTGRR